MTRLSMFIFMLYFQFPSILWLFNLSINIFFEILFFFFEDFTFSRKKNIKLTNTNILSDLLQVCLCFTFLLFLFLFFLLYDYLTFQLSFPLKLLVFGNVNFSSKNIPKLAFLKTTVTDSHLYFSCTFRQPIKPMSIY